MKFPLFWKENKPHTASIYQVIDLKISAYLNTKMGFFLKTLWQ